MLTTQDIMGMSLTHEQRLYYTCLEAHMLLAEHGWSQGQTTDASGGMCLRGAINRAAWGDANIEGWWRDGTPQNDLLRELEIAMGFDEPDRCDPEAHPMSDAARWNNDPNTTLADVFERLERAMERYSPQPVAA